MHFSRLPSERHHCFLLRITMFNHIIHECISNAYICYAILHVSPGMMLRDRALLDPGSRRRSLHRSNEKH
jgi:hypothetical protein